MNIARTSRRGATAVEMAIVLPVILNLIIGMIDFGYVMYVNNTVGEAARYGARYAIVNGSQAPSPVGPTANNATVATKVQNSLPGLDASKATITSAWSNSSNAPGETVTVTVSFSYVTVIGRLVGFAPALTLTGTSTMIIVH